MSQEEIKVSLVDNDQVSDVGLDYFVNNLGVIKVCLDEIAKTYNSTETITFKVADLSHSSPSCISIEPCGTKAKSLFCEYFVKYTRAAWERETAPPNMDWRVFRAAKKMVNKLFQAEITTRIEHENNAVKIVGRSEPETVEDKRIFDRTHGEIFGTISEIRIKAERSFFYLQRFNENNIKCYFKDFDVKELADLVDSHVRVEGFFYFEKTVGDLDFINVNSVNKFDCPDEWDFESMLGSAPSLTGALSTMEFIEKVRCEYER